MALDSRGNVYVAELNNNTIRRGIPLPVAQTPALTNETLMLTWNLAVGQVLQPQYSADLDQTNWVNRGGQLVATNGTLTVSDSMSPSSQRSYRVVVLP